MKRLRFTSAAINDLADIFDYIANESGSLAIGEAFVKTLRQQCKRLASLPGQLGIARPDLRLDIRSFPYRGYVIFFRYDGDKLEIVNIMHGQRDLSAHFSRS